MVMSGSQRSKEDDVQKISTSMFVTNFSDGYGAKDLWNTCNLYGHVVDVFIPNRRTNAGKTFGFVRFIKVLDIDRLINNLCTVWVGRNKLHANVARVQREPLHKQSNKVNNKGMNNVNHGVKGKVKEFASLTNLKVVLGKEGYANIELKYMGGFLVMILFQDDETKKRFQFNLAVGSWFSQIIQAHNDFIIDERVIWMEVRGWVPDFKEDGEEGYDVNDGSHEDDMYGGVSGNLKDMEGESDREEFHETNFEDGKNIDDKHEDSLKYPPGFTPNEEGDVPVEKVDNCLDKNRVNDGQKDEVCVGQHVHEWVEVSNDTHESTCPGHFKKSEVLRKGGSILELIDDLINMGQTMGYDMTGCLAQKAKKDWVKELCVSYKEGEVVIMRDFNEVHDISKRFGLIFNKHGAEAFNSFIVNASLVEVLLGGCSFTWCHKSTKKMSKLDRFLIYDNLMCSCPSISSTSLDRFLSNHRPIIMREAHYDYVPIPFKFFHYCKFMNKLKYLKDKIQIWARLHKESFNSRKSILKAKLADLDGVIDKGEGLDADGHRRQEVVRFIQEVEKNDELEREVSNEEIKRAVWDRGIDKALGPDGFTFGFYRWY
nr:nucleotide-binding alpha-beta plait domain-containing protein [Tanacetum cinerariifolium]